MRNQLDTCGLRRVAVAVETAELPVEEIEDACRAAAFDSLAREALKEDPKLARFSGKSHSILQEQFIDCDNKLQTLQRQQVAWAIDQIDPPVGTWGARVGDLTELNLLNHECSKKKRHIAIRELVERAGKALLALKPCFMMGPMSVAQYLKPGGVHFDLVVMDEASQIKPQDAIGAVARGGQLVVVGDPKQLPPTSFFDRLADTDDDDNPSNVEEAESILDAVWPLFHRRLLRWHYRSQHQDLIAFSNDSFYDGDLILFPSPYKESNGYGIHYHRVPRGNFVNNRNLEEARVIADAVVRHFRVRADETLGVACMNAEQRLHIERTIEALAKDDPVLQKALDEDAKRRESLFIKNLENVQGDERDVMLISMTYGPREPGGRVMQRFGPINSATGWRRLNVLFTRAKKQMHIFSSMDSGDIVVGPSAKRGVAALRDFLSYCETGMLATTGKDTGRPPDSDFEVAVIAALQREGFDCRPQVGVAGFFIDVAVVDPGKPGRYLVGIECDGATY
ncbi:MAG: AAA domain-containing protein, partial [Sinobacteraceae bacterium]|nr:AAA domain-containing protein [Nevskiaceae bacterium]